MHVACLPAFPNLRLPVWCRRFKPTTVVLSVLGDQFRCYCSRSDTSTSKGWMSLIRNCWSVAVQCGSCAEAVGIRDWHASLGADSHCQWHASGPAADLGDLQAPSTSSSTFTILLCGLKLLLPVLLRGLKQSHASTVQCSSLSHAARQG